MSKNLIINKVKNLFLIKSLRFPIDDFVYLTVVENGKMQNVKIVNVPEKEMLLLDTGRIFGKFKLKYQEIFK